MIKKFLTIFKLKYGRDYVSSNLHNLSHLVDEVKRFGVLSKFDAYPFENRLQAIKKLVRQRQHPLIEIARRVIEQDSVNEIHFTDNKKNAHQVFLTSKSKFDCEIFKQFNNKYTVYDVIDFHDFRISNTKNDKWFLTKHFEIVACKYIVSYDEENILIYGASLKEKHNLFEKPVKSSALFIFAAKNELGILKPYSLEDIICKIVRLPYFGDFNDFEDLDDENNFQFDSVFIPLWHTLN